MAGWPTARPAAARLTESDSLWLPLKLGLWWYNTIPRACHQLTVEPGDGDHLTQHREHDGRARRERVQDLEPVHPSLEHVTPWRYNDKT